MESSSPPPPPPSPHPSPSAAVAVSATTAPTNTATASNSGGGEDGVCEQGKLFVGGIPWDATEEALRDYFGKYGEVAEATIMRDRGTGNARGFGFVSFVYQSAADRVIQDTSAKHSILGRPVEVKRAIPRGVQHRNQHYHNDYQHQSGGLNKGNSRTAEAGHTRTKKIFVGGLSANLTEEEFKSYFERFGRISDVVVMYDNTTHRPRGFGFITFDSEESVDNAVKNTFQTINGKTVEVKRAVPREGNSPSNNHTKNRDNRNGYNPRIGNGRGSMLDTYPGGISSPYSPRYGVFQGFGAPPYPPFVYGQGGYGGGYAFGGYAIGYGGPYTSLRGTWNGPGFVDARQNTIPYGVGGFYSGYLSRDLNPFVDTGTGSYCGSVASADGKWNQSDNDSHLQAVSSMTSSRVGDGSLDDLQSTDG